MKTEYAPFDIASHLDSDEMIAGYLTAAAEDEDPNVLLGALAHAARARGMSEVAKAAGLGRESLYKALAPGAHPRYTTIRAVLHALDVRLSVLPPSASPTSMKLAKAHRKTSQPKNSANVAKARLAAKKRAVKKVAAKALKPAKRRA